MALFMIVAIALLHKAGMSSRLGGSWNYSTWFAFLWVCLVCCGSVAVVAFVFGLGSKFLAVFLSRAMRFSCLVSYFAMGGVVLCL